MLKESLRGLYYVYILTNKYRTTFYIGMTNDLLRRMSEHLDGKENGKRSFTARYYVTELIYYETYLYVNQAIEREKELKGWRKSKKIALIQNTNYQMETIILNSSKS